MSEKTDSKDLLEALGYVDHILHEEGYETWCEARCTITRAKKACIELVEKSMELAGMKQANKNLQEAAEQLEADLDASQSLMDALEKSCFKYQQEIKKKDKEIADLRAENSKLLSI